MKRQLYLTQGQGVQYFYQRTYQLGRLLLMYQATKLLMNTNALQQVLLTKYQMQRLEVFDHQNQLQLIRLNNKARQRSRHRFHQRQGAQLFSLNHEPRYHQF